ncbi:GDSL esterase/lipase At5g14450-like [Ipomoea triloba]|uniref:GDSL esterase/lipase At5g14450-like n=1 Tax=Ipomoea triloba TaxID=35885 RepID=UPI00125E325B|nr:GDSL esterase/lipase At5g14450-like [Ipomoea triloba]
MDRRRVRSIFTSQFSFYHRNMILIVGIVLAVAATATLSFFQFSRSQKIRSPRVQSTRSSCHIPAIFNFGDSNSDTGSSSAAFARVRPPNGMTFFGKPSGRVSDGRLIIDFIAEKLGLPYLSAFLDSIGTNFTHGANFAVGGATIQQSNAKMFGVGFSPLSLDKQLSQFEQLRMRSAEFSEQAKDKDVKCKLLPEEDEFSRGLYTMDMGQNDLHYLLTSMTEEEAKKSISSVIDQFAVAVEKLHELGARAFWIHNTGPIGCLPFLALVESPAKPKDQNGCVKAYNNMAQEFNRQLKERVYKLRHHLQNSTITYIDIYSAKYDLISNATDYGFRNPLGYCCGKINVLTCWADMTVNGTKVFADSCNNPSEYISWDGIHYTEAANKWVANHIADGLYSDPQISIIGACDLSYNSQNKT